VPEFTRFRDDRHRPPATPAGRFLSQTGVPVHVARDLTPAQIRGLHLAGNRTNREASWDEELLGLELAELNNVGFDLGLSGFDVYELDSLRGCYQPGGSRGFARDIQLSAQL
jgi:hypothetical protein